jgi:integrase
MSLKKRGKTWWVDFTTPNGERIRRSTKTTIKRQAQEYYDKLRNQLWERERLGIQSGKTWDDAALKWVKSTKGTASYKRNLSKLKWLQTYLRGKSLDDINQSLIEEIGEIKMEESSGATANRYLAVISVVLHSALRWEWIQRVPYIARYKESEGSPRWLRHQEYKKLYEALPDYLKPMVQFSIATGLRQSNVKYLQWGQVDIEKKKAWIHNYQTKNGKSLSVPLNNEAITALESVKGKSDTYVFLSKTGQVLHDPNNKDWREALVKAGIKDFRWHDLRHTWASWHVQNGTPLMVLKNLGGWKTLSMVERYAHLAPEHLAEFADNAIPKVA